MEKIITIRKDNNSYILFTGDEWKIIISKDEMVVNVKQIVLLLNFTIGDKFKLITEIDELDKAGIAFSKFLEGLIEEINKFE